MERLQMVLAGRAQELVSVLVRHRTFDASTAERFVAAAGRDLIRSYEWQLQDLERDGVSRARAVRDLLRAIHARKIAVALGLSTEQVWRGLRTFVPTVVQMADAIHTQVEEERPELVGAGFPV